MLYPHSQAARLWNIEEQECNPQLCSSPLLKPVTMLPPQQPILKKLKRYCALKMH